MNAEEIKLLTEIISDAISHHPPEGNSFYVSSSNQHLPGHNPEERLGRPLFDLYHVNDREKIQGLHNMVKINLALVSSLLSLQKYSMEYSELRQILTH
ncbi:MAG: hypothetical protein WD355_07110 [Balneolaceae bacterium]